MPFKVFVIGDPHIKLSNATETDLMHSATQQTLLECRYDFVVVLGDILDRFESIHVKPLDRAIAYLDMINQLCSHTFLLIGNHDRANNNVFLTKEHPFNALKKWPNLTVVDTTLVKTMTSLDGEEASFLFVPYVYAGRFKEALQIVDLDYPIQLKEHNEEGWKRLRSICCVFAHQEFHGCKVGMNSSIDGDFWHDDAPMCISGHIHDYHRLKHNMLYVGTPIQHGTSDTGKKSVSAFTISLSDSVDEEKSENVIWNIEEERIDLDIPKKIHIKVTVEELLAFEVPNNASFIRLDLEIDPIEYKQLLKNKHVIALLKADVHIKPIDTRKKVERDKIKVPNFKISYSNRIQKAIRREEKEVQDVYTELFGVLKASPKKLSPKVRSKVTMVVTSKKKSPLQTE